MPRAQSRNSVKLESALVVVLERSVPIDLSHDFGVPMAVAAQPIFFTALKKADQVKYVFSAERARGMGIGDWTTCANRTRG